MTKAINFVNNTAEFMKEMSKPASILVIQKDGNWFKVNYPSLYAAICLGMSELKKTVPNIHSIKCLTEEVENE